MAYFFTFAVKRQTYNFYIVGIILHVIYYMLHIVAHICLLFKKYKYINP